MAAQLRQISLRQTRRGSLLAEPRALLLDESFSKFDAALRDDLRAFTFEHIRNRRIPALMVTHDPADAEAAGGSLVELTELAN